MNNMQSAFTIERAPRRLQERRYQQHEGELVFTTSASGGSKAWDPTSLPVPEPRPSDCTVP